MSSTLLQQPKARNEHADHATDESCPKFADKSTDHEKHIQIMRAFDSVVAPRFSLPPLSIFQELD